MKMNADFMKQKLSKTIVVNQLFGQEIKISDKKSEFEHHEPKELLQSIVKREKLILDLMEEIKLGI